MALNYLPYCKQEYIEEADIDKNKKTTEKPNVHADSPLLTQEDDTSIIQTELYAQQESIRNVQTQPNFTNAQNSMQPINPAMSTSTYLLYLVFIGWVNAMTNGVLISVQPFACLPYGDQTYHLSVTLCNIINPVACCVAFFIAVKSTMVITIITAVGSVISCYIWIIAFYSPEPPLLYSVAGPIIIVSIHVHVKSLLKNGCK